MPVAHGGRLVVALLLGAGCAGSPREDRLPEPEAPERVGRVGHEFLGGEGGADTLLAENQEYKPPLVREAPMPVYPPRALAAHASPHTIVVKILVGTDGRAEDVLDSPRQPSEAGAFETEFRRAVDEVLRQWVFTPALVCTYDPGADLDGDGTPDYRIERSRVPLRVLYDVRFDFEIVEGKGTVQRGGGEPQR